MRKIAVLLIACAAPSLAVVGGAVQPIVPVGGVVYGSQYKTLTSTTAVQIDTTTARLNVKNINISGTCTGPGCSTGSGVPSVNASGNAAIITAVTLLGGTNVTLSQAGSTITITASGSGGGTAALGVSSGSATSSVVVSSPTSNIVVDSNTFILSLQGSTSSFLKINTSSITAQGNSVSLAALASSMTAVGASTGTLASSVVSLGVSTNTLAVSTGTLFTLANGKVNYSSFTATQPILYNNVTGALSATPISLSTGAFGTLQAAQEPAHTGNVTNTAGSLFMTATGVSLSTQVVGTIPVANGGTGTASPGLIAGTNITSITGSWPNQTINATTQGGGGTSSLAVTTGTSAGFNTVISSPTGVLLVDGRQFNVSPQGGATAYISLNLSSVTAQGVITAGTLGAATLGSFSAAQPLLYNNGTGAFSATPISLSTGAVGVLQAAQSPAYVGDVTSPAGSLTMTAVANQANIVTLSGSSVTITNTAKISTLTIIQNGVVPLSYPNNPILMTGNANGYFQTNLQNLSAGTSASADIVITSDLGGDTSNYLDIGINSSHNSQSGFTIAPSTWGYLYTSDHGLAIGAGANGTDPAASIVFWTGNSIIADQWMSISSTGTIMTFGNVNFSSGVALSGSAGTSGQVLQSNGPGTVPTWATGGGGVSLSSTNTWTGGNTFTSSTTFSGSTTTWSNVAGTVYGNATTLDVTSATFKVSTFTVTGSITASGMVTASSMTLQPLIDGTSIFWLKNAAGATMARIDTSSNVVGDIVVGIFVSTNASYSLGVGTNPAGPYALIISTGGNISSEANLSAASVLSSCGSSPAINTNCSNRSCTITPGSVASGCTFTFTPPFKNAPTCIVGEETMSLVNALAWTESATTLTITQTSLTSKLDFICDGKD